MNIAKTLVILWLIYSILFSFYKAGKFATPNYKEIKEGKKHSYYYIYSALVISAITAGIYFYW